MKLYIEKPIDRDAVVAALARNGYTVRIGREKAGSRTIFFVEATKND